MNKWTPADYIVLILTLTVSIIMIFIMFLPLQKVVTVMREETVKLIFMIISSLIAVISMYIGARLENNRNNNTKN